MITLLIVFTLCFPILQPDVVAIYIGDDRTDEDAFRALQEGQQGGRVWCGGGRMESEVCMCVGGGLASPL